MHVIKSVGILSCAKIAAAIQAAMGLIIMPFFLLIAMVGAVAGTRATDRLSSAIVVVVALFLPVFYGVVGFIMGALAGWIYNLVSKWIGGIELELQPPAAIAAATSTYSGD
ncbi:MAG TPA: hypothetical protein VF011_19355 [Terriglobales bacterium]